MNFDTNTTALDLPQKEIDRFMTLLQSELDLGVSYVEPTVAFFDRHYNEFGPQVMAAALNADPWCHSHAHNLGRVIYVREGNLARATALCRNSCGSGCIHGALMGMVEEETGGQNDTEHVTIKSLSPRLLKKMQLLCSDSVITQFTGIGNCFHAVGHALTVLANYDIEKGLTLCGIFSYLGKGAEYYCATGIYMERDIEHGTEDVAVSPGSPCTTHSYPAGCFRYQLRRAFSLPNEYRDAKKLCESLAGNERSGCFHGLGFGAYKMVLEKPSRIVDLCETEQVLDRNMCIDGALGLISIINMPVVRTACSSYPEDLYQLCIKLAMVQNFGMNRDFSLFAVTNDFAGE